MIFVKVVLKTGAYVEIIVQYVELKQKLDINIELNNYTMDNSIQKSLAPPRSRRTK